MGNALCGNVLSIQNFRRTVWRLDLGVILVGWGNLLKKEGSGLGENLLIWLMQQSDGILRNLRGTFWAENHLPLGKNAIFPGKYHRTIPRESSVYNFGRNEFSLENGPNWKFSPGAKNLARGFFLMISNCLEFSPEFEISPAVWNFSWELEKSDFPVQTKISDHRSSSVY